MIKHKIISCGVVITNGTQILICHPTGHTQTTWDLPKGRQDPGEETIATAVRELSEETGIHITTDQVTLIGEYEYKHTKTLVLFKHTVEVMPDVTTLHCPSEFEFNGVMIKEMDDYAVVDIEQALSMVNPDLERILRSIFKAE
jgi:8-oxo-dGTP pyrophosphatase MutT (NUDIX family)